VRHRTLNNELSSMLRVLCASDFFFVKRSPGASIKSVREVKCYVQKHYYLGRTEVSVLQFF